MTTDTQANVRVNSHERIRQALMGISGVAVTPFDDAGRIDRATLALVIDRIAAAGIDNIVSGGNTGEYYTLAADEIRTLYEVTVQANAGRRLVTAGVGKALVEACDQARAAAAAGVDLLMIHQPPDPFASPEGMVAYVHAVAEATALPCILYLRRDVFSERDFAHLIGHPKVLGMKFAVPDAVKLSERVRQCAPLNKIAVCGLAEPWAPAMAASGAKGFTSGLVNVFPELSVQVRDALRRGDFAAAHAACERIAGFEALRAMQGNGWNVTVVKQAMRRLGIPVGPARAPATAVLPPAHAAELDTILRMWGCSLV